MLAATLASLALFASRGPVAADSISAKQAQIEALHARLERKRDLLNFQQRRTSDLANQLSETNGSIARVTASLVKSKDASLGTNASSTGIRCS